MIIARPPAVSIRLEDLPCRGPLNVANSTPKRKILYGNENSGYIQRTMIEKRPKSKCTEDATLDKFDAKKLYTIICTYTLGIEIYAHASAIVININSMILTP